MYPVFPPKIQTATYKVPSTTCVHKIKEYSLPTAPVCDCIEHKRHAQAALIVKHHSCQLVNLRIKTRLLCSCPILNCNNALWTCVYGFYFVSLLRKLSFRPDLQRQIYTVCVKLFTGSGYFSIWVPAPGVPIKRNCKRFAQEIVTHHSVQSLHFPILPAGLFILTVAFLVWRWSLEFPRGKDFSNACLKKKN